MDAFSDLPEPAPTSNPPLPEPTSPSSAAERFLEAVLGPLPRPRARFLWELLHIVGLVLVRYADWMPDDARWSTLARQAADHADAVRELSESVAPLRRGRRAMDGDTGKYQIVSGLLQTLALQDREGMRCLWALVLWPWLAPTQARPEEVMPPARVKALGVLLRKLAANDSSEAALQLLRIRRPADVSACVGGLDGEARDALSECARRVCSQLSDSRSLAVPVQADPTAGRGHSPSPTTSEPVGATVRSSHPVETSVLAPPDAAAAVPPPAPRCVGPAAEESATPGKAPSSAFASPRDNNHITLQWNTLCPAEAREWSRLARLTEYQASVPAGVLGTLLIAILGLHPNNLEDLEVVDDFAAAAALADQGRVVMARVQDALIGLLPHTLPKGAHPRPAETPGLLPHLPYSIVGMADLVSRSLRGTGRLGQLVPGILAATRAYLDTLRDATAIRFHAARFGRCIELQVIAATGDEVLAGMCVAHPRRPQGTGAYYTAASIERLHQIHAAAVQTLLGVNVAALPVQLPPEVRAAMTGSRVALSEAHVMGAWTALRARIEPSMTTHRRDKRKVAKAYNDLALYTQLVLLAATTHRPHHRAFGKAESLCTWSRRAYVEDKRSHERAGRIVPLPSTAFHQLEALYETATTAADYFVDEPEIARHLRNIRGGPIEVPRFSMIEHNEQTWTLRPITPADWRAFWPECGWVSGNWCRRHLIQWLTGRTDRESINVLAGHSEVGQTAFGVDSSYAVNDFCAAIGPLLEQYCESHAIRPIPAMRPYRRT